MSKLNKRRRKEWLPFVGNTKNIKFYFGVKNIHMHLDLISKIEVCLLTKRLKHTKNSTNLPDM